MSIHETLLHISTFTQLESFFKDATEGVTYFGYRYIKVNGLKGTLHIDALAIKVMDIANVPLLHNNIEKDAAKKFVRKVNDLYQKNDKRKSGVITARDTWNCISNFINHENPLYSVRYYWEDNDIDFIETIAKMQFHEIYNQPTIDNQPPTDITKIKALGYLLRPLPLEILYDISSGSLYDITYRAQEGISFFGYRYVKVEGYLDTVSIDALAEKVMNMIKPKFDFNENERIVYRRIADRINKLYKSNDKRCVNVISMFFCIMRDLWKYLTTSRSMSPRYQWFTQKENETFEYYTREQYEQAFKAPVPENAISKTRRVGFNNITVYRPVQAVVR